MKKLLRFVFGVLLGAMFLFCGCKVSAGKENPEESGKLFCGSLYVFERQYLIGRTEQHAIPGDYFTLTLSDDGTFTYYETYISSYIGFGQWTREGELITLVNDDGRTNVLRADGTDLVWQAEGSDNFLFMKAKDGERFHLTYEYHE